VIPNTKRILLGSSILLLPFTLVAFQFATRLLGPRLGYLTGLGLYWAYALAVAAWLARGRKGYLRKLLDPGALTRPRVLWSALCFIPVFGVFFIAFLPNVASLSARLLLLVAATAAANGFVEELYWRGLYLREFGDNALIGLWIATGLFGGWHVSLYLIEGITFHGGFGALVGGATIMGLLWSYASRRLGNVAAASLAHVLVNAFTFTGLYVENGF
jgi:membrane protease YdiL (CAAX protease family)